jgi:hypothetical protein
MKQREELINVLRGNNCRAIRTLNVRVLLHGFSGSFQGLIVLNDKTDLSPITTM